MNVKNKVPPQTPPPEKTIYVYVIAVFNEITSMKTVFYIQECLKVFERKNYNYLYF